jgi:Trk K+ transport system NAD-binding subunit
MAVGLKNASTKEVYTNPHNYELEQNDKIIFIANAKGLEAFKNLQ